MVKNLAVDWRVQRFDEISRAELYAVLAARAAVFVVEQECPYQDVDGLDQVGLHVSALGGSGDLVAYARVLPPETRFAEVSIGRVLTVQSVRGIGLGRELMRQAMAAAEQTFPDQALRISAQQHLERFYHELGFETVSDPYPEDGIPHLEMFRPTACD